MTLVAPVSGESILTVQGGNLTADGGDGAGLYYDRRGSQGTSTGNRYLRIANNSVVRISRLACATGPSVKIQYDSSSGGIYMSNGEGIVYGPVTLREDLTIESGQTLTIPKDASLTIPDANITLTNRGTVTIEEDGTLTNNCLLANDGTVTVNGTIENHHIRNDRTFDGSGTIQNISPNGSFFNYGTVTVSNVEGNQITQCFTGVQISPSSLTLTVGQTADLTAVLTPAGANYQSVSWSSDNTAIATVAKTGNGTTATVTARSPGTAIITIGGENADGDKLPEATCAVTVTGLVTPLSDDSEPSYSPVLDVGDGGTVKVNPRTPGERDQITLTVTPRPGVCGGAGLRHRPQRQGRGRGRPPGRHLHLHPAPVPPSPASSLPSCCTASPSSWAVMSPWGRTPTSSAMWTPLTWRSTPSPPCSGPAAPASSPAPPTGG